MFQPQGSSPSSSASTCLDSDSDTQAQETKRQLLRQFSKLSKEELLGKLVNLELEFRAFVEESKEMEDFLENEVESNSNRIDELRKISDLKDSQISALKKDLLELHKKFNKQADESNRQLTSYQVQLNEYSKKLVNLEIQNDQLENEHRIQKSLLKQETENNNELLERLANYENELVLLKKSSNLDKRVISQLRFKVEEHNREINHLETKTADVGKLKKIARLMALNRGDMKIARYKTPPVESRYLY